MSERPPHTAQDLDEEAARELLSGTERVRNVARAHRRMLSVPLYVLGALLLGYAALLMVEHRQMMTLDPGESRMATATELALRMALGSYWATAGAIGLVAIGVWFRRHSQRTGAGPGGQAWVVAGAVVLVLVAVGAILPVAGPLFFVAGFLAPTLFIVVPLLVIAAQRRSAQLAAWVVAFGVVTILAGLGFFTNRFADVVRLTGLESRVSVDLIVGADLVVLVILAVVLLVGAERARRSDARPPS